MRSILIALLLTAVALAGCSGDTEEPTEGPSELDNPAGDEGAGAASDGDDSTEPSDEPSNEPADSQPAPQANETQENAVPTLTFTASADAGEIPFDVTFAIDGEDADGDALTWSLMIDGVEISTSTEVPIDVTHRFDAEGVYNATVTMTDGEAAVSASLDITATAAAPTYDGPAPFVIAGSITVAAPLCMGDGIGGDWHYYSDDLDGWTYVVDGSAVDATFYDSEVNNLGGGTSGRVPAGAVEVDICATGPGAGDYTFTAWHPEHPENPGS